jgi:chemotaxis protein methyltransferase CheR
MELQSRAHGIFFSSLIRLGYLALGRDESVASSPYAQGYRKVETESSVYRRIG